jgi:hypothetical protein
MTDWSHRDVIVIEDSGVVSGPSKSVSRRDNNGHGVMVGGDEKALDPCVKRIVATVLVNSDLHSAYATVLRVLHNVSTHYTMQLLTNTLYFGRVLLHRCHCHVRIDSTSARFLWKRCI